MNRLLRTEALVGAEGIACLQAAHITVVGAGGVGGATLEALVRGGVGTVTVIDGDTLSETNLNRQLLATAETVGQAKTAAAAERARLIAPDCTLYPKQAILTAETVEELIPQDTDYVADCIDDAAAKLVLALVCGFVLDRAVALRRGGWGGFSGRKEDVFCGEEHESEGNIVLAALRHTAQVFVLVFVLTFAFGGLMELAGESWVASVLARVGVLQVPLAALLGFVPNCAVSVLLMQLYSGGLLSFGALFAGLCSGAGVGLIVLWRTNPNKKSNLKLMGVLYLCAVAGGYAASLLG